MHSVLRDTTTTTSTTSTTTTSTTTTTTPFSRNNHPRVAYLFLFGGLGAALPYLPLYIHLGFSLSLLQIGWLRGLALSLSSACAPLWGCLFDKLYAAKREGAIKRSVYRLALIFTILSSCFTRFSIQFVPGQSFIALLLIATLAETFAAPVIPTLDALVAYSLTDGRRFGSHRLWGSVGFGVAAVFAGVVVLSDTSLNLSLWISVFLLVPAATLLAYAPFVEMGGDVTSLSPAASASAPRNHDGRRVKLYRELCEILCSSKTTRIEFWMVLIVATLIGATAGILETFLLLTLRVRLNASYAVLGLAQLSASASEIPVYLVSGRVLDCFGIRGTLALSCLAYLIRSAAYASMTSSPWVSILLEPLHGVGFGCACVALAAYARRVAPEALATTMQTVLEGSRAGMGCALGAILGGLCFGTESTDPSAAFGLGAGLAGAGLVLVLLLNWRAVCGFLCCCCVRRSYREGARAPSIRASDEYRRVNSSVDASFSMDEATNMFMYDDDDDDEDVEHTKEDHHLFALEADLGAIAAMGTMREFEAEEEEEDAAMVSTRSASIEGGFRHKLAELGNVEMSDRSAIIFEDSDEDEEEDGEEEKKTLSKENPFRERLVAFYTKRNPSRLSSVDTILSKYEGREEDLFRKLEQKYSKAKAATTLGGVVDDNGGGDVLASIGAYARGRLS